MQGAQAFLNGTAHKQGLTVVFFFLECGDRGGCPS